MATVDLRPGRLNIKSTRGDAVALPITIKEGGVIVDLTGRTYFGQIRRIKSNVIVEIDVDTTNAETGQLIFRLSDIDTEELSGEYVWDLEQRIGGVPRTILSGKWTFDPDVSREEF